MSSLRARAWMDLSEDTRAKFDTTGLNRTVSTDFDNFVQTIHDRGDAKYGGDPKKCMDAIQKFLPILQATISSILTSAATAGSTVPTLDHILNQVLLVEDVAKKCKNTEVHNVFLSLEIFLRSYIQSLIDEENTRRAAAATARAAAARTVAAAAPVSARTRASRIISHASRIISSRIPEEIKQRPRYAVAFLLMTVLFLLFVKFGLYDSLCDSYKWHRANRHLIMPDQMYRAKDGGAAQVAAVIDYYMDNEEDAGSIVRANPTSNFPLITKENDVDVMKTFSFNEGVRSLTTSSMDQASFTLLTASSLTAAQQKAFRFQTSCFKLQRYGEREESVHNKLFDSFLTSSISSSIKALLLKNTQVDQRSPLIDSVPLKIKSVIDSIGVAGVTTDFNEDFDTLANNIAYSKNTSLINTSIEKYIKKYAEESMEFADKNQKIIDDAITAVEIDASSCEALPNMRQFGKDFMESVSKIPSALSLGASAMVLRKASMTGEGAVNAILAAVLYGATSLDTGKTMLTISQMVGAFIAIRRSLK